MVICVDTREQRPLDFSLWKDITVQRREVYPGDYTVLGARPYLALERKSVADLIGTMKSGYAGYFATTPKRFDRELMALKGIRLDGGIAAIIVEPDGITGTVTPAYEQILNHSYRSAIEPSKIIRFCETITYLYRVPVYFTDSRTNSAEMVRELSYAALAIKKARAAQDKLLDKVGETIEAPVPNVTNAPLVEDF